MRTWSIGLCVIASVSSGARAQWTETGLHPPGFNYSIAEGASGSSQYGFAELRAAMWSGSVGSFVSLHPSDPNLNESAVYAADATQQGGYVGLRVPSVYHAAVWNGSAASWVDLSSAPSDFSMVFGVGGGHQVGEYRPASGGRYAAVWSGTPGSLVLLSANATALATDGVQQVGHVGTFATPATARAVMWTGSAASQVLLHPSWAATSAATGVSNGRQAGYVGGGGTTHAGYWTGTAASWVDLTPGGGFSKAFGISGNYIVGIRGPNSAERACIWDLGAGTFTDLQVLMPANCTQSWADGVFVEGNTLTVVGSGQFNGNSQACMWRRTIPPPGACRADFNGDGDAGTDGDIEDFFRCLAGNCCAGCGSSDYNGDGEYGTDADVEAFFRVMAGNPC